MHEFPNELTAEEQRLKTDKEQNEQYWLKVYSETGSTLELSRLEAGPEIAEFNALIVSFELQYSIPELISIIDLTPAEALVHPLREPARLALRPILAKLNTLKSETNISPDEYDRLKVEFKRLSRAVGMINNNQVDHNR